MVRNICVSTLVFVLSITACEVIHQMNDEHPEFKETPEAAPPPPPEEKHNDELQFDDDELVEV